MPQQVTDESGVVHEFPDEATPDMIMAALKPAPAATAAPTAERPPSFLRGAVFDPGMYNPVNRLSEQQRQGQVPSGAGFLMGLTAPALAATEMVAPEAYRKLESGYQTLRQQYGQSGMDIPRLAGEAPYMQVLPELKAATAAGRIGAAALTGGMGAAITPTEKTSGSRLGNKAEQMEWGAALGGLFGGMGKAVGRLGKKAGAEVDAFTRADPLQRTKAEAQVQEFAANKLGVNADQLTDNIQKMLKNVAVSAGNLDKLDPKAVERLNLLQSVNVKGATRGQVTRDPLQRQAEIQAQQTSGGQILRDLSEQQNKDLLNNLKYLTGERSIPYESTTAGQTVREAAEAKLKSLERGVSRLYKTAERVAGDTPVESQALADHYNTHADPAVVPYLKNKLPRGSYTVAEDGSIQLNRPLTLKELEIVRKAATIAKKGGGTAGYYAGEVTDLIDGMTRDYGGKVYAEARAARRAVGEEFERTQAVNNIIKTRGLSREKAVAVEDIWRTSVRNGSVEDLAKLKKSLTEPLAEGRVGTKRTEQLAAKGRKAFDDLRAATADYLIGKATRSPKNAAGDPNVQWGAFRNAVNEIGPEKLEILYGKKAAQDIQKTVEALEILKTEAPNDWKGSQTFKHLLGLMDKLGAAGDIVSGAVKGVQQLSQMGKAGRIARKAVEQPLGVKTPMTLKDDYSRRAGQAAFGAYISGDRTDQNP